ncbi:MAG: hypothetical protein V1831_00995 [Candidatus Woesearchaeota archaeon]
MLKNIYKSFPNLENERFIYQLYYSIVVIKKSSDSVLVNIMEDFFDEDNVEIENMREERKKLNSKEFGKLINKRDLSDFELDELFM